MKGNNHEIERRWLLKSRPLLKELRKYGKVEELSIFQAYLKDKTRVRMTTEINKDAADFFDRWKITYHHTIKKPIPGKKFGNIEIEREITEAEYNEMMKTAKSFITKIRYRLPYGKDDLYWELDIFEKPTHIIILEIELPDHKHKVKVPEWLKPHIIREITKVKGFSNLNLSLPYERPE